MLYKIGTEREVPALKAKLPTPVYEALLTSTVILDMEYGAGRNYLQQSGGYSLIAETTEDVATIKEIINYDAHSCEWAERLGPDGCYISAIYILNDDFSITLYIPFAIAPDTILKELEEERL